MPTYDYQCDKCHKTFEVWQKITEDPLSVCPDKKCGGKAMRTIGGGAGFILKGSGFYATDYRSGDYKKRVKGEAGASAPSTAGTSGTPAAGKSGTPSAADSPIKPKPGGKSGT